MSTDAYLLRKYGIDRKEKRRMANAQGNACKICRKTHTKDGRPILFHVDHCHTIPKIKVVATKTSLGWVAETINPPAKYPKLHFIWAYGRTRMEAVLQVRKQLRRAATRYLVCWSCNSLLAKGRDNPDVFDAAASYLREFESRFQ